MQRTQQIHFRITVDELRLLRNLSNHTKQDMTDLMIDALILLSKDKTKIKEYQELTKNIENKKKNQQAHDQKKQERYVLYAFKNFMRGITDVMLTSYQITGKFNQKLKLHEIKIIEEFYNNADPRLKKMFAEEIKIIKTFKKNNQIENNIRLLINTRQAFPPSQSAKNPKSFSDRIQTGQFVVPSLPVAESKIKEVIVVQEDVK